MRGIYHIEAPVEQVFDFFKDPSKQAWLFPDTEIRELKLTEEGTGTYTSYHTKFVGVPLDLFSVFTDVVPNEHITEKSSSAMVGTWEYDFEPEGTGTKVTMEHHSRSFWDLPPLRNIGDLITARANGAYMQRMKERIEASSS
ncbi:MAG TPA: SRPBCC family protein [Marmoricola sp.]|nr:SRPBCC family protein [Marmoricola sp.]